MNMSLNMKYGRHIFPQIWDLDTRANLCKNSFYPGTIKTDTGDVATRNFIVRRERNQQLHQIKKYGIVE